MIRDVPEGFEPLHTIRQLLSTLTVPWWIVGVWAIDLAVGEVTRSHSDIDVMLLERDEHALRHLPIDLQLVVGPEDQEQPWPTTRRLIAGPDRVRLISPRLPMPTEVLFGAAVGTTWVYHRGKPTTLRSLKEAGRDRYEIPYLSPEVVLTFKSISERDKDQHDFEAALPLLDRDQREWLLDTVTRQWRGHRSRAGNPESIPAEHPWTVQLQPR